MLTVLQRALLLAAALSVPGVAFATEPTFRPDRGLVDAAVTGRGKVYLFAGDRYNRYTKTSAGWTLDTGYPRELPGGWEGLPPQFLRDLDAALFNPENGKTYLFQGNEYVRLTGVRVDGGYPRELVEGWPGLPDEFASGIDAALYRGGHVYLFKGAKYVRYTQNRLDPPGLRDFPGGWILTGDWDGVQAAVTIDSGPLGYFFGTDEYGRLNDVTMEKGYPRRIVDYWPGLVETTACLEVREAPETFAGLVALSNTGRPTETAACDTVEGGVRCIVESKGGAQTVVTWPVPQAPAQALAHCASSATLRAGDSGQRPGTLCSYSCGCSDPVTVGLQQTGCDESPPGSGGSGGAADSSEATARAVARDYLERFATPPPPDAELHAVCYGGGPEVRVEPCRVSIDDSPVEAVFVNLLHPEEPTEACAEAWNSLEKIELCAYRCQREGERIVVAPIANECDVEPTGSTF